jgi:6-phosphogluconolactonase
LLPADETLNNYAAELRLLAPRGFDLLILGAGKDGHFASIFPGFRDWDSKEITCRTETDVFEIRERFSLTPSYLRLSRKVLLLLKGKDKADLIMKLEDSSLMPEQFPLGFWTSHPGLEVLYCGD